MLARRFGRDPEIFPRVACGIREVDILLEERDELRRGVGDSGDEHRRKLHEVLLNRPRNGNRTPADALF
ncbi:MAG TPA: hypothetical protein VK762_08405 [Polyangiaceae bacterium]|nr:hypothetical protein [Polyangiaceae bacterium]